MKLLVFVFATAVVTYAQFNYSPLQRNQLVSHQEVRDDRGQFALSYQTGDGQTFTEHGALRQSRDGAGYVLVKQGSVAYISPEGVPVRWNYLADENGFHQLSARR